MEVKPLRVPTLDQSAPVRQNTITGVTQAPQWYPTGPASWTSQAPAAPSGGTNAGDNAPAGGDGSSAPTPPPLNMAAVRNTQLTLDQIPGLLQAALAAENLDYNNLVKGFNTQEQGQRKTYEGSTVTNQKNYDANMMDSVRGGVRGLQGLMAFLRGSGVERQAEGIVGNQTNRDIREGLDTRNENQTELDSVLSAFLTDLQLKKQKAEDTKINNERAYTRDFKTQQQKLYGDMAGFYSDAGDRGNAEAWMNRAGALTPEIAANSTRKVSAYDQTPVAVKAAEISAFAEPVDQAITANSNGGQIGSGIFTIGDRRRREMTPAGA